MSNFASAILGASVENISRLQAVLDSHLPVRKTSASSLGLTSTSSTTGVDMDAYAINVTDVADDEILIYTFHHSVSSGSVTPFPPVIGGVTLRGATNLNNYMYSQPSTLSALGQSDMQTMIFIDENQSGTLTYYQKFWLNVGSGITIYSLGRIYNLLQLKKRA